MVVFLNQWNGGKEGKRRLEERISRIQGERERERGERKKKRKEGNRYWKGGIKRSFVRKKLQQYK